MGPSGAGEGAGSPLGPAGMIDAAALSSLFLGVGEQEALGVLPLPRSSPRSPGRMPVLSVSGLSGFSCVFVLTLGGVYLLLLECQ